MSHDIEAIHPDATKEECERLSRALDLDNYDDTWLDRWSEYKKQVVVASLSRSMGNPCNAAIYHALGVYDEAYSGCSGNGSVIEISETQFINALSILMKPIAKMKRDPHIADEIVEHFFGVKMPRETSDVDLSRERQFCRNCILFLRARKLNSLRVSFA